MRVKPVRKFADVLNGIDLTHVRLGDVLDLAPYHAALLVAEGWAEPLTNCRAASGQESAERQNR